MDGVSAAFVTPLPPGFPVLVPGQLFSRQILSFMRDLDTVEIHGYKPDFGYRGYTEKAIEMTDHPDVPTANGHRPLAPQPPASAPTRPRWRCPATPLAPSGIQPPRHPQPRPHR